MSRSNSGSVTVRSVAQEAGVSVATVSRVMAGAANVSAERREQVLTAAQRLGYQPNQMARSLATGSSRSVGVVVPNLSNPYFYDVIRGLGRASAAGGYRMVVSDSMEDPAAERDLVEDLLRFVDALVLVAPRQARAQLDALAATAKPAVTLIGPHAAGPLPDATVDNRGGMLALYQHLAELGHRRVVYLGGPAAALQNTIRQEAALEAADLGLEVVVVPAGGTIEAGRDATDAALAHEPTAIAGYNDLVALGALHRLGQRGVRVPEDVSVTGFDDIAFSGFSSPALTTVATPREELGRLGWELLHERMTGRPSRSPAPLSAELVVRASTGPPRGRG
ncbi:LacI family DNA-binding transcriptional regulator [Georgenia subflava]|uniref:LacI family DNA-binding transcriptional regulator n=1 Tax=Georgenia subflava TaxID=1622177 RepID=A0A6N7EK34_9MICO|nr:LacI family DNA-binding transcriptional regulator [Georgenia subflava]MPV36915.1 LacI family DNA-binding transcriptional regulator [Georgenia subflava]